MPIGDIIQWIAILILAGWLFVTICVVAVLSTKVERILESGWFPQTKGDTEQ